MAEHLLHAAQVGAVREQMAREGMAEHVRRHARGVEPGIGGERLKRARELRPRQMPSGRFFMPGGPLFFYFFGILENPHGFPCKNTRLAQQAARRKKT